MNEFEYTANRQKILELLRTSSDGSQPIRGTQDQKVRAYGLRHIVWMLAIKIDLQRAPNANRFLEFSLKCPTAEESGKLNIPKRNILCERGEKLLLAVFGTLSKSFGRRNGSSKCRLKAKTPARFKTLPPLP